MYYVTNDSSNEEPSYIKVIDEEGTTLVYLHGPMSMFAAGAFINALEKNTDGNSNCIPDAAKHWRN